MSFVIFTDVSGGKIALRSNDIVKVYSGENEDGLSHIEYIPGREGKVHEATVKHPLQEVVDALHKMYTLF
jgi:hypothetical protein